jgi:predicted nucleotidyltransferase
VATCQNARVPGLLVRTMDPLLADLASIVAEWAGRERLVQRVWFFGSRVRGQHQPSSDLDVAVELDMAVALDECGGLTHWMHESERWERELASLLPYAVDLEWHEPHSRVETFVRASSLPVYTKSR